MDYYCDVCDKTNKIGNKSKHLISFTHKEFQKCTKTEHTIKNSAFLTYMMYLTNTSPITIQIMNNISLNIILI